MAAQVEEEVASVEFGVNQAAAAEADDEAVAEESVCH